MYQSCRCVDGICALRGRGEDISNKENSYFGTLVKICQRFFKTCMIITKIMTVKNLILALIFHNLLRN